MKDILLSIIIPVYNVEKYILPCLESIFKQELKEDEFEVILVDDGCTDNTRNLIETFKQNHTNITIIEQCNLGPASARNKGMKYAQGKYILFVDSDDLLIENSIQQMLEIAINNSLDILKAEVITIENKDVEKGNYPKRATWSNTIGTVIEGEKGFISNYDPNGSYVFMNLFKRDFLRKNKLQFIENLFFIEDVAFSISCYLKAKRFIAIPYVHYIYRRNDASIMSTMNKQKLCDANTVITTLFLQSEDSTLSKDTILKLRETTFACYSVVMWYLSHYTSLYPQRKEVIADLKKKCPNLSFNGNIKQRITTFFYKYIPSVYISFRYLTAKRKYNQ